ncbi:hypothetical protein GCM10010123_46490 [Pilimelia anulata]|uniref:F5/8 type C domain-containing protein n=2 Tax=Pilimelia anulata TaxID=53371 RepID=A0A8J3BC68_9ACTN|nr:hypothetical protein GCM10010123_46490 [Pilimelia anulata]
MLDDVTLPDTGTYKITLDPQGTATATLTAKFTDLRTPGSVQAVAVDAQTVDVSWVPVAGVSWYRVFRDGVALTDTASTSLRDTQLDDGRAYSYQVASLDGSSVESAKSAPVSVTTPQGATGLVNYARCGAANGQDGCAYTASVAASPYHPDTGGRSLTDGQRGSVSYGSQWQGRDGTGTYSFVVDLGQSRSIKEISSGWFQVKSDFVFLPTKVTYSVSTDGQTFQPAGAVDKPLVSDANQAKNYRAIGLNATGRYVKVVIDAGSAWTMTDEIQIMGQ